MKRFLIAVLSLSMCLSITACSGSTGTSSDSEAASSGDTESVKPGAGATKMGIVLGGSRDDYGFNYSFVSLAERVEEEVGIEVVIEYEDGSTESRFIDLY